MNEPKIDHKTLEQFLLTLPGSHLDYPFGEDAAVYKTGEKMFAIVAENKQPLRVSIKCDPELSRLLQAKYESVMPGYHLNKKHWITVLINTQLSWQEVQDLIVLSHRLVSGQDSKIA